MVCLTTLSIAAVGWLSNQDLEWMRPWPDLGLSSGTVVGKD